MDPATIRLTRTAFALHELMSVFIEQYMEEEEEETAAAAAARASNLIGVSEDSHSEKLKKSSIPESSLPETRHQETPPSQVSPSPNSSVWPPISQASPFKTSLSSPIRGPKLFTFYPSPMRTPPPPPPPTAAIQEAERTKNPVCRAQTIRAHKSAWLFALFNLFLEDDGLQCKCGLPSCGKESIFTDGVDESEIETAGISESVDYSESKAYRRRAGASNISTPLENKTVVFPGIGRYGLRSTIKGVKSEEKESEIGGAENDKDEKEVKLEETKESEPHEDTTDLYLLALDQMHHATTLQRILQNEVHDQEKQQPEPKPSRKRRKIGNRDEIDDKITLAVELNHACKQCEKRFSTNGGLQSHIRNIHTRRFRCRKCGNGEVYESMRAVQDHQKRDHQDGAVPSAAVGREDEIDGARQTRNVDQCDDLGVIAGSEGSATVVKEQQEGAQQDDAEFQASVDREDTIRCRPQAL